MSGASRDAGAMDPKLLAHTRREALAHRARRIRRSVAGLAVALFTVVFVIVYVQLASGHDPALVANARRRTAAATEAASAGKSSSSEANSSETSSAGTETSSTDTENESSSSEASTTEASSSGVSPVTTSQS
jgi:hypothetical protein